MLYRPIAMNPLVTLAQSLGIAFASGISLYATIALLGIGERMHWIGPLPGALGPLESIPIIALAGSLAIVEFLATLIPGVAAAWESVHTAIRPTAAAALAVLTAWHASPVLVMLAALLGGGLAFTTHAAKLGVRVAIDASPEPLTNGVANVAEIGVVAWLCSQIWHHPFITLALALLLLVVVILALRAIWHMLRSAFSEILRPGSTGPGART